MSDGRRTVVGRSSAAPVSSAAPKKKSFDQGGPVWPPRSNALFFGAVDDTGAADDRPGRTPGRTSGQRQRPHATPRLDARLAGGRLISHSLKLFVMLPRGIWEPPGLAVVRRVVRRILEFKVDVWGGVPFNFWSERRSRESGFQKASKMSKENGRSSIKTFSKKIHS